MAEEFTENDKTPVTIITGFLGSGKTTLVNYILKEQNEWKICVVENEFGEVQIDGDLVEENLAAKEDIITMDNGCVCCSVRGDLVRTFGMLTETRKKFQAIIIETTGLADPAPIAFTFNTNALIQDNFRIDSIVCLVDAKHVNIHLDDIKPEGSINEAEQQIAFADRIILNKTDLVTPEELEDVEDRIRSMNSFARLIRTERSRAPLDQILGLNSFSLEKMTELDPTLLEEEEDHGHVHDEHCGHHVHDEHCGHGCSEDHHAHGHDHEVCHKEDCSEAHEHCHEHHEKSHDHDHEVCHKEGCSEGHEHCHEHHEKSNDHDHEVCHKEGCSEAHEHCHEHHEKSHDHKHEHDHSPEKKKKRKIHNLSLVSSVGFVIQGQLNVVRFNTFMTSLLQAKAADLYRTKGVLDFADQGDTKFVFQGVHEQINFGPSEKPWAEGEKRGSKMVFIGKNLDYEFFKTSLLECCEDPSTSIVTMHKRA